VRQHFSVACPIVRVTGLPAEFAFEAGVGNDAVRDNPAEAVRYFGSRGRCAVIEICRRCADLRGEPSEDFAFGRGGVIGHVVNSVGECGGRGKSRPNRRCRVFDVDEV